MRLVSLLFLSLAVVCGAFAYWGLHTVAGRRAFDEMAGMVPLAAGALGVLFLIVAAAAAWRAAVSAGTMKRR